MRPEKQNKPEGSGDKRERDLRWSHENVKAKNIDEHLAEKKHTERDGRVCKHEQAADELSREKDNVNRSPIDWATEWSGDPM